MKFIANLITRDRRTRALPATLIAMAAAAALSAAPGAAQNVTTLASFNGVNGSQLAGGVIMDSAGNLYGTASYGASGNLGTVFQVSPSSGTVTDLAAFNVTNGAHPTGRLLADSAGNLFGTAYGGNGAGLGTVFEIPAGAQNAVPIVSFNTANGANPDGGVIADPGGNLYGTTQVGGAAGNGTVFEVATGTHTLTKLASFNGGNGLWPSSGVVRDTNGNLYGTTPYGGAYNLGTVFEINASTHQLTTLATFNGSNGRGPWGGLAIDAAGNLFGTTSYGGTNDLGTVFKIDAVTHTLTTLVSFNATDGDDVEAAVILGAGGELIGTTAWGGTNNLGNVFELDLTTGNLTTLATFDDASGGHPYAPLLLGSDRNLYGTTAGAGAYPDGTVFEIVLPETDSRWIFALIVLRVSLRRRRWSGEVTASGRP
jgi:uncharacterized repeat protein (TIGR03803 family)